MSDNLALNIRDFSLVYRSTVVTITKSSHVVIILREIYLFATTSTHRH